MSAPASPGLKGPASHLPTKVFKGHTDTLHSVAYLKDGKRLISGSWDGMVRIWNAENGMQESESMVDVSRVTSIEISPDEKNLVSGGNGTTLWDLESRAVVWTQKEVNGLCVAFSPDGQLIAASDDKEIALLDVKSGKRIREPLQVGEPVNSCLAFSLDGTRLGAGSSDGKVWIFDVSTGKTVVGPFQAHTSKVTSLIFTLDAQQLITASTDASIRVWNSENGREVGEPMLGHKIYIYHIALSSGGQRIASASRDCTVGIWDLSTRRQIGDPLQAQNGLHSVAWSPDGLSIVAGDVEGTIYLWTVPPLQDSISAPILNASSPPLPSTSRSRANSGSSSILNLPAGPSVAQPQSPELNNSPGEEDNWENSTNESFDSVLDLPADGKHPAQRRKRRRRRVAPAASTSSPPISTVPNASLGYNHIAPPSMLKPQQHQAPHVIISAPHHSPPLDQTPRPPVQTTPRAHVEADASASHVGALSRLWSPRRILSRWNGRNDRNHLDEPHENPPTASRFGSIPRLWGRASNPTGRTNSESRTGHDDAHEMQSAPSHPISTLPANVPDMQLPPKPPRTPTSRAVKVSAAYGFNRTHAATSDEDDEVPCRDYICFCMCCPCKGSLKPDSDLESDTGS